MERIAVLSDIHGNLMALEAVLSDLASRGVDATINLGDCVAGPLWPRETFELLADLNIPTVRGNHDRWILDRPEAQMPRAGLFARAALSEVQHAALHALPATLQLTPEILAVHGTPTDDCAYLREEMTEDGRLAPARRALLAERLGGAAAWPVMLCGHSHRQALVMGPAGGLILNPGSVGCPAFADGASATALELRSPHARYALLTRRRGRWGAELLALEYDWNAASRRAAELGWPRWAQALATGSVA